MEILSKIIRGIASIPLVGGFFVLIVGFLPVIALIPLNLSTGLTMIIGGVLTAVWCYLLNAKKIINIVTPVFPIPNWVLGVLMAIGGVYGMVTNAWDDSKIDAERVPQEITPSKNVPAPVPELKPEPAPVSIPETSVQDEAANAEAMENTKKLQEAKNVDLDKIRDEASERALVQMEKSLDEMKKLSEQLGPEKLQEIFDAQGSSENSMNFEEAMAEMQKQIDALKSQGYGADNAN